MYVVDKIVYSAIELTLALIRYIIQLSGQRMTSYNSILLKIITYIKHKKDHYINFEWFGKEGQTRLYVRECTVKYIWKYIYKVIEYEGTSITKSKCLKVHCSSHHQPQWQLVPATYTGCSRSIQHELVIHHLSQHTLLSSQGSSLDS